MIPLTHISDLHMGERILWRKLGRALQPFDPNDPKRLKHNRPTNWGHDERVAWDLANEWAEIVKTWPAARLVATGDLTRSGTGQQFGLAHRYVHALWMIDPPALWTLGLGAGGDRGL